VAQGTTFANSSEGADCFSWQEVVALNIKKIKEQNKQTHHKTLSNIQTTHNI